TRVSHSAITARCLFQAADGIRGFHGTGVQPCARPISTPAMVREAAASGIVHGIKPYPAGATTSADAGVRDLARVHPVLEAMAERSEERRVGNGCRRHRSPRAECEGTTAPQNRVKTAAH